MRRLALPLLVGLVSLCPVSVVGQSLEVRGGIGFVYHLKRTKPTTDQSVVPEQFREPQQTEYPSVNAFYQAGSLLSDLDVAYGDTVGTSRLRVGLFLQRDVVSTEQIEVERALGKTLRMHQSVAYLDWIPNPQSDAVYYFHFGVGVKRYRGVTDVDGGALNVHFRKVPVVHSGLGGEVYMDANQRWSLGVRVSIEYSKTKRTEAVIESDSGQQRSESLSDSSSLYDPAFGFRVTLRRRFAL